MEETDANPGQLHREEDFNASEKKTLLRQTLYLTIELSEIVAR